MSTRNNPEIDIRNRPKIVFLMPKTPQDGILSANRLPRDCRMVSHNSAIPPEPMPNSVFLQHDLRAADTSLVLLNQPKIAAPNLMYLAYAPLELPQEGLLAPIGTDYLPIDRNGEEFQLRSQIVQQWLDIEESLVRTVRALRPFSPSLGDIAEPPFPRSRGFDKAFKTEGYAYGVARRAQRAFKPWLGLISYSLVVCNPHSDTVPPWIIYLQNHGIPRSWMDEISSGTTWSFTGENERVGGILSCISAPSASIEYRRMIANGILAWYIYLDSDKAELATTIGSHIYNILDTDEVYAPPQAISDWYDEQNEGFQGDLSASPISCKTYPSAKQLPGESPEDFMKRRSEGNQRTAAAESSKDKMSRLQREKHYSKHPEPITRPGPTYFRWVRYLYTYTSTEKYWVRKPTTRWDARAIWWNYNDYQRRYDSFNHEWDICSIWRPVHGAVQESGKSIDDELAEDSDDDEQLNSLDTAATDPYLANESWREPAPSQNEGLLQIENVDETLMFSDVHHFLQHYFVYDPVLYSNEMVPTKGLKVVQRMLGDVREKFLDEASPQEQKILWSRVSQFFSAVLHKEDIRPATAYIRSIYRVTAVQVQLQKWYKITTTTSESDEYDIVVLSAMALNYLMSTVNCEEASFCHSAIRLLVEKGIPFSTVRRCNKSPPSLSEPPIIGLGYRPEGWVPDLQDLAMYERRREEVLLGVRGRAAFLQGGIIWRLAMLCFTGTEALSVATLGPSFEATSCNGLEDDHLTKDEMEVLCGSFLVYTGKDQKVGQKRKVEDREKSHQTERQSFFPPPHLWSSLGYWSQFDEDWFRNHLKEMTSGNFRMRTTKDWRSLMTSLSNRQKFVRNREEKVAEALNLGYDVAT